MCHLAPPFIFINRKIKTISTLKKKFKALENLDGKSFPNSGENLLFVVIRLT
jgi:hypothetical protein